MDMAQIIELITTVGFPIVCVLGLGWFIWHIYQQSVKREERLMDVNEKAIATIAMYADRLDEIQTDVQIIKQDMMILLQEGENK